MDTEEQTQPILPLSIHHQHPPPLTLRRLRFQGTSQAGRYGDFIHELDWIVGEVMEVLEEEGIADNTLVIFTSDNGGMFNVGGQDSWKDGHRMNGDLLGFKFGAWEGGHRVPFIVRWPGKTPAASVSDQLVSNVDLLATMAALTEQKLEDDEGPDSFNILPALTGNPKANTRPPRPKPPSKDQFDDSQRQVGLHRWTRQRWISVNWKPTMNAEVPEPISSPSTSTAISKTGNLRRTLLQPNSTIWKPIFPKRLTCTKLILKLFDK